MKLGVVYSLEEVLEPLGGPDNLRLMCDAQNISMTGHNEVKFKIKNDLYTVKRDVSVLSEESYWNLEKVSTYGLVEQRSHVFHPELFVRIFEKFSGLSTSF